MFKISDFARFSRVSAKMLRHYDEIGLLKPAHVDPFTDYRYYTADQLPRLNRIVVLKDLGFTLDQIAHLLDEDLPVEQIKGMLRLKRAEVEQLVEAEQARLAQIEARLKQIEHEGQLPQYEVVLRPVEGGPVAALSEAEVTEENLFDLVGEVEWFVARHKARAGGPPVITYYNCDWESWEVEVAVPIQTPLPSSTRVRVSELPPVARMAGIVHTGPYAHTSQAWDVLCHWVEAQQYRMIGPAREVCLRYPARAPGAGTHPAAPALFTAGDPAECVTELQLPVGKPGDV